VSKVTDFKKHVNEPGAYNPSYSGGREDPGPKPAQANSSQLEKTITKKGWWNGSRCRPSSNSTTTKKKKKKKSLFTFYLQKKKVAKISRKQ
jgi:hypothetical protein